MQTFPALYPNGWQCFKQTLKQEGIPRGLYAGTLPSLAAQISENSVLFLSYGLCQKLVISMSRKSDVSDLSVFQNALSGSFAAFFSSLTLCPTELVKCKLQAMREMKVSGNVAGQPTNHMYVDQGYTLIFSLLLCIESNFTKFLIYGVWIKFFSFLP